MWCPRYVGEMGRETATARLERRVDGTFLLRVRPHPQQTPNHAPNDTNYALSLKYIYKTHTIQPISALILTFLSVSYECGVKSF